MKENRFLVWVWIVLGVVVGILIFIPSFIGMNSAKPPAKSGGPVTVTNPLVTVGPGPTDNVPEVKPDFRRVEIDPAKLYLSDKKISDTKIRDLCCMSGAPESKNREKVFKTSAGEFHVVSCFGRYSTNPDAFTDPSDGEEIGVVIRCDLIYLPNGKWIAGFPGQVDIQKIFESPDKKVYLMCPHCVIEVVALDKWTVVVSLKGGDGPYISYGDSADGSIADCCWKVCKSSASEFGGLLKYDKGEWSFHLTLVD